MSKAVAAVLAAAAALVPVGGAAPAAAQAARPPAVLPSAGCGTSDVAAGQETLGFTSGGVERTWIRHVPPAHDGATPLPLVLALHGFGEGVAHPAMTEYAPRADAEGFVVAFPQALGSPVAWSPLPGSADMVFVEELLDHLEATMCLDTNRVYVSGFSLGAVMTSRIACDLADRVAAVAPVAGAHAPADCAPSRPVPVLSIHGTDDALVPYAGGEEAVAAWAARNGCGAGVAEQFVAEDDVARVVRRVHDCPAGAEAEMHRIEGGGHAWAGSELSRQASSITGYTTFAIHASDVIWAFFEDHVVDDDIVAYTARYSEAFAGRLDALARGLGAPSREAVVAMGVGGFRRLADGGRAVVGPQEPNEGPVWVTVTYPEEEADAIEAAAAAWGADGHELHHAGGRVVAELIRNALRQAASGAGAS